MGGAWASPERRPLFADRRVFCNIDGEDHGIGWQCKELDRRGMRATFFCEVLSSLVLGEHDTRSYLDFLLLHGQDVQLHVHPNFYYYAQYLSAIQKGLEYDHTIRSDNLACCSKIEQFQLLQKACCIFKKLTGKNPLAFRAGNYSANRQILSMLARLGVAIDSSFNPCYQGNGSFDGESVIFNLPQLIAGVWELPVTVALESLPDPRKHNRYMPLEISSLSLKEMIGVLDELQNAGATHIILVVHSFSCVKPKDIQYSALRPNRIVQRRFSGLLDYLAREAQRFTVSTLHEFTNSVEVSMLPERQLAIPALGYLKPLIRKGIQVLDRCYRF